MKYLVYFITASFLLLVSCTQEEKQRKTYGGVEDYMPIYNAEVAEWVGNELSQAKIKLAKEIEKRSDSEADQKKVEARISELEREVQKYEFRQAHGDYFKILPITDLPKNIEWTSGRKQPEIGDSRAKKGGLMRDYLQAFPSTLRPFGPESNSSFRGKLYDEVELGLVGVHPATSETFPAVASHWALSEDKQTVYYKLNPNAKYNDGNKVQAIDFLTAIYIRVSPFVMDPYAKQYYKEQIAGFTIYGDEVVALTMPEQKPRVEQFGASVTPAPSYFYKDYGPDYDTHYQWKVPPTTGAYYVKPEDVKKGISVKLTRAKDWWAKDMRYYRYRYNADNILYTVVRDETKAFELFRAGKLDTFLLTRPNYWFKKSEIVPVYDGYIERYKFYTQYPRVPRGFYMNVQRGLLKDKNVRIGLQYSFNMTKVIDTVYRGEYSRLQRFHTGYGEFSNNEIKARQFSILEAKKYFAKAGFTKENREGYLINDKGEVLRVTLTFSQTSETGKKMMNILKEDCKKAGVKLVLDGIDDTQAYEKVIKKKHEMTFWGWGCGPPFPVFYQFFHSSNALDENGKPKPNTNNINCYANDEMDKYCEITRNARTEEEIKEASLKAQQLIYDEAFFIPAFMVDYICIGSWRWIQWPDSETTPFSMPIMYDALAEYCYWIDEEKKKETLEAVKSGKTFPEVQKVIDVFRDGIPNEYKEVKGE